MGRRVNSVDQNTDRQLDGVEVERTFVDKVSDKDTARPKLEDVQTVGVLDLTNV